MRAAFFLLVARPVKAWKNRSDRIRFVYSSDRTLTRLAPFDVVFCMAVLRAPKKQQRLGNYPFTRFEERALFLELLVRPGGLFVIHNSMYRFSDTAHLGTYDRIPVDAKTTKACSFPTPSPKSSPTPAYGESSKLDTASECHVGIASKLNQLQDIEQT